MDDSKRSRVMQVTSHGTLSAASGQTYFGLSSCRRERQSSYNTSTSNAFATADRGLGSSGGRKMPAKPGWRRRLDSAKLSCFFLRDSTLGTRRNREIKQSKSCCLVPSLTHTHVHLFFKNT